MRRLSPLLGVFAIVTLAACAEPPHKEMNQAQGAIDAARAAGAERYASKELTAAVDALRESEQAVAQNDYRLALSRALDSLAQAQNAAKHAVEARAEARGEAERAVAEVGVLLTQARRRLDDPAVSKLPRRTLDESRRALDAAEKIVQEARSALAADDYPRAIAQAKDASPRIHATLDAIDEALAAPAVRKRR